MIRVLFVSHDSLLYGAQQSLLGLVSQLDARDFAARVVTPYVGPLNQELETLGVPTVARSVRHWIASGHDGDRGRMAVGLRFAAGLKARVWAIAKQIESYGIDVVYTNTVTVLEGALAARATGRPHIWHLREQVPGNSQLVSAAPNWTIPHVVGCLSQRVIVNSQHLHAVYFRKVHARKFHVVYNGIDVARFRVDRPISAAALRFELGLPDSARVVVNVGSIIPSKNQALLLQAAKIILSRTPNVHFVLVGEGDAEYIASLRQFCNDCGISGSVHWVGYRRDIAHILAASDLLAVTANEESFGRTIVEAMAASTPAVSTRCGGPEEIIEDGVSGRLVPRGDQIALAEAILGMLSNRSELDRLAGAGRVRVENNFTLAAHTLQIQSIIRRTKRDDVVPTNSDLS